MTTRFKANEYENLILQTLHQGLVSEKHAIGREGLIKIEDIRIEASKPERMIVVLFRETARPECLFGWRFPVSDESSQENSTGETTQTLGPEQAIAWARAIVLSNFLEQIEASGLGLPSKCDPDDVTWVGEYMPQNI